jgi:hypothetical protein
MSDNVVPVPPNLPLPAPEFSQQYLNVLTNVLRLYFTPLSNSAQTSANDISSLTTLTWLNM